MRKPPTIAFLLLSSAFLITGPSDDAWAAEKLPPACAIEPRAYKVLVDALSYLSSAKQFTFQVEGTLDLVQEGGRQIQFGSLDKVAVRRSGGLRMDSENDAGEMTFWYDGRRFTLLNHKDLSYFSAANPGTNDAALAGLAKDYNFTFPLARFIREDASKSFCDEVLAGFEAGVHKVRGVDCHHLVLLGQNVDTQAWIDAGAVPLIRKIVFTFKNQDGVPSFIGYVSDWDFAVSLPDSAFESTLPRGALLKPIAAFAARGENEVKQGVKP